MRILRMSLLGSAAGLVAAAGAQGADLPVRKAAPIEYVRVCGTYGAGFFYIPGTDTCLRISGRARFEAGYLDSASRNLGAQSGDLAGFISQMRVNVDARTQTDYGTLRAFLRLDAMSRTGNVKIAPGTLLRSASAVTGTGQDTLGRVESYFNVDKAFVQFAGLTAGRASSFFDFYAQDYEIIGSSLGSGLASTNLLAYTKIFGECWSTTLSMEDPSFRKNPIYSDPVGITTTTGAAGINNIFTTAPTPIILGVGANGNATSVAFVDAVQRSRMPDFVGSLRYDAAWGSAQISAAVKDINTGGFISGSAVGTVTAPTAVAAALAARGVTAGSQTDYGWAVQGGVKFNLPFIAAGDGLYLQGAYGQGANLYTGITRFTGSYSNSLPTYTGNPFNQWLSDAIVNPLTGKLDLTKSFTVVASYLHYWSPNWRSAFYGSYGELGFSKSARSAVSLTSGLIGAGSATSPPSFVTNAVGYALSPALRDTGQIVAGASLIWSPVRDLDIGIEGQYARTSLLSGRSLNADKTTTVAVSGVALPLYSKSSEDVYQARFRVQRDF